MGLNGNLHVHNECDYFVQDENYCSVLCEDDRHQVTMVLKMLGRVFIPYNFGFV